MDKNRVVKLFSECRIAGKKVLIPFLTAGYPDTKATAAMLSGLESRNIKICELGIPFSDPIADGPTIQASYTAALEAHITLAEILETASGYRQNGGQMALLAMVSYTMVFRRGVAQFCQVLHDAGFDGIVVPDLPIEESGELTKISGSINLCSVALISPTTPPKRQIELAENSSGFVYFMSVAGITGERKILPDSTFQAVEELKKHTDIPICIGFGISEPAMVKQAADASDGAIVGSAIIHRINDGLAAGVSNEKIVQDVCDFCSELLEPIQ